MLTGEANEICEKTGKKTIGPEHLLQALGDLGFPEYVEPVREAWQEYNKDVEAKHSRRASNKRKLVDSGLTQEELEKQQEDLFKAARERMQAAKTINELATKVENRSKVPKLSDDDEGEAVVLSGPE